MKESPGVDLQQYLRRIGVVGELPATPATLQALHLAHATHIPFENIDVLLGRGIDLDPAALERKLVASERGGYCFEHNLLFATVLEDLGFKVTLLSGRVRAGAESIRPRTHMLLLVTFPGSRWIADVGFGSGGLLFPVPFDPAAESAQFHWTYRVVPEGAAWVMQSRREGDWADLYVFTLDAHERIDYDVLNHYTSTYPRSVFRSNLIAQLPLPERRITLRNRELTSDAGDSVTTRILDDAELNAVLNDVFGIVLPAGTRLPIPD